MLKQLKILIKKINSFSTDHFHFCNMFVSYSFCFFVVLVVVNFRLFFCLRSFAHLFALGVFQQALQREEREKKDVRNLNVAALYGLQPRRPVISNVTNLKKKRKKEWTEKEWSENNYLHNEHLMSVTVSIINLIFAGQCGFLSTIFETMLKIMHNICGNASHLASYKCKIVENCWECDCCILLLLRFCTCLPLNDCELRDVLCNTFHCWIIHALFTLNLSSVFWLAVGRIFFFFLDLFFRQLL